GPVQPCSGLSKSPREVSTPTSVRYSFFRSQTVVQTRRKMRAKWRKKRMRRLKRKRRKMRARSK
ncbi:hypothetical protein M5D96_007568, partial [Drosophila gunungcola]